MTKTIVYIVSQCPIPIKDNFLLPLLKEYFKQYFKMHAAYQMTCQMQIPHPPVFQECTVFTSSSTTSTSRSRPSRWTSLRTAVPLARSPSTPSRTEDSRYVYLYPTHFPQLLVLITCTCSSEILDHKILGTFRPNCVFLKHTFSKLGNKWVDVNF